MHVSEQIQRTAHDVPIATHSALLSTFKTCFVQVVDDEENDEPWPLPVTKSLIVAYLLFTSRDSLICILYSLLTTQYAIRNTFYALLYTHRSTLTAHRSPLTTHHSPLTTYCVGDRPCPLLGWAMCNWLRAMEVASR